MSEIKLKPCPFCGNGKIEILTDNEINGLDDFNSNYNEHPYFLACCSTYVNGCGATGGEGKSVQEAIDKWNRRWIPMIPPTVTAQEHKVTVRNGKPVFYDPPELKEARAKLTAHLAQHKPEKPYTCGVRLITRWCFPVEGHADGEYRTTKPDTDNLQKMLKDCMTKCYFWQDDALVASELCEKFWAEIPGIFVRIEVLE